MIALFVAAQLAVQTPIAPVARTDTATYSSDRVRDLVTEAARINRVVPAELGQYRAKAESEIAFGMHAANGREASLSIEQVESEVTWNRSGEFDQRITDYRTSGQIGFAALYGFFRNSWVVPSLYGNRIAVMFGRDTARYPVRRDTTKGARKPDSTYLAVHPLADDRERYYRFTGGDTVEVLTIDGREVRIVRVNVLPREPGSPHTLLFGGELDFDADRKHLIRMNGAFYTGNPASGETIGIIGLRYLLLVELVNGEVDGKYWLPQYQRLELQVDMALFGPTKLVSRVVSRIRDVTIAPPGRTDAAADSLRVAPHRVHWASRDSLNAFHDWQSGIGDATSHLSTDDFNAVGPSRNRLTGRPIVTLEGEALSDFIHFNRVEGAYTGLAATARLRDAAPGVTLIAVAGQAWNENQPRGRVSAELARNSWTYAIRAGRSLDITNDFHGTLDSGSSLGALVGSDDFDYVDRSSVGAAIAHTFGRRTAMVRLEAGWADDRPVVSHLTRSPIGRTLYLPNRGVDAGSYARSAATFEWHMDNLENFQLRPGLGASLKYLRGDGALHFQRVELGLRADHDIDRWRVGARADAGAVMGSPPPQQLFEIGGNGDGLDAYDYKAFAGDRAAQARGYVMYRLRGLTAPIILSLRRDGAQGLVIPGFSPALFLSVQGAWAGASNDIARDAIARLGVKQIHDSLSAVELAPVSVPMARPLGSVGGGVTFFGGIVGLGASRSFERIAKWKERVVFGLYF